MADWLIKSLRILTTVLSLGVVSGGAFYLTNKSKVIDSKTFVNREEDDIESFKKIENNPQGTKKRPILEECKEKWKSSNWDWKKDKRCKGIYITQHEEEGFWMTL